MCFFRRKLLRIIINKNNELMVNKYEERLFRWCVRFIDSNFLYIFFDFFSYFCGYKKFEVGLRRCSGLDVWFLGGLLVLSVGWRWLEIAFLIVVRG